MPERKRRTYRKPGLVEALCQVGFKQPVGWDMTKFGLMLAELKSDGYTVPEEMRQILVQLAPFDQQTPKPDPSAPGSLMRYKRPDGTGMVQLAPDKFVVNQMETYHGWEVFKPMVLTAFGHLVDVVAPTQYTTFAVRYINQFDFPAPANLTEFLLALPHAPDVLQQRGHFAMKQTYYDADNNQLGLVVSSVVGVPNVFRVMLDLEFTCDLPDNWSVENLSESLEVAHKVISEAFEDCITDKLRVQMEEVEA